MRHEQIAGIPRQFDAKNRRKYRLAEDCPGIAAIGGLVWTIGRVNGIRALRLLEPAEPS